MQIERTAGVEQQGRVIAAALQGDLALADSNFLVGAA